MIRRSKLSFSKAELFRSQLNAGVGLTLPMPANKDELKTMMESFGFFGDGNNANVFIPNLDIQNDLMPKPEDFIHVPFRLLSATTVAAGSWRSTDFSDTAVLKASAAKLNRKPVYLDHNQDIMNWVGLVQSTKWTGQTTQDVNGEMLTIPAGIDGVISIDGKTNPKIARGVLIGSIFSGSVTVDFSWKPSHEFADNDQFERAIGTIAKDGQMVRRIVTNVHDYYEYSLVWLGADPFAKKIEQDGSLVNVDSTAVYAEEQAKVIQQYNEDKKYSISFSVNKNLLSLSTSKSKYKVEPPKETAMTLDELKAAFRKKMKLAADAEVTVAMIEALNLEASLSTEQAAQIALATEVTGLVVAAVKKVDAAKADKDINVTEFLKENTFVKAERLTALEKAETDLTVEKGKVTTLTAEKTDLTARAAIGDQFTTMKRTECARLYTLAMANKPADAILTLIKGAKPDELEGLLAQYTKGLKVSFGGRCKKCNSEEFEFRSTLVEQGNESLEVAASDVSFESMHDKFSQKSMNIAKVDEKKD